MFQFLIVECRCRQMNPPRCSTNVTVCDFGLLTLILHPVWRKSTGLYGQLFLLNVLNTLYIHIVRVKSFIIYRIMSSTELYNTVPDFGLLTLVMYSLYPVWSARIEMHSHLFLLLNALSIDSLPVKSSHMAITHIFSK